MHAELQVWLLATQRTVAIGSDTGKAIEHALKRLQALERNARFGIVPLYNNLNENAMCPPAIGRTTDYLPARGALAVAPPSTASLRPSISTDCTLLAGLVEHTKTADLPEQQDRLVAAIYGLYAGQILS